MYLRVRRSSEELTHSLGRFPSVSELAAAIGTRQERVLEALSYVSRMLRSAAERPLEELAGS